MVSIPLGPRLDVATRRAAATVVRPRRPRPRRVSGRVVEGGGARLVTPAARGMIHSSRRTRPIVERRVACRARVSFSRAVRRERAVDVRDRKTRRGATATRRGATARQWALLETGRRSTLSLDDGSTFSLEEGPHFAAAAAARIGRGAFASPPRQGGRIGRGIRIGAIQARAPQPPAAPARGGAGSHGPAEAPRPRRGGSGHGRRRRDEVSGRERVLSF